ncbi:MAG: bifunctional glutamate N-acetyltransferase/amino-acid acetyltransferase ArgJ, partial [Endomicrobiales bacterium]
MLPKGFAALGMHSGIAKKKGKKDLAVFYSHVPAVAAGMLTTNLVKAAPVLASAARLGKKDGVCAIVANSGNANACTGARGKKDAEQMCAVAAGELGVGAGRVLVASTGVIGRFLPMERVVRGIRDIAAELRSGLSDETSATQAIMTTDTFPKVSRRVVRLGGRTITVWGCAKGSGMIHPSLSGLHATMFCFILTDAAVSRPCLGKALDAAVSASFNCVTVDGDTSTNDTVFALANGAAGNAPLRGAGREYDAFSRALAGVCLDLAKLIAKDGEGATRLVEIEVRSAANADASKKIASTIATSPLVKTAVFGNDANWGRIIAAAGRAGVRFNPD